MFPSTLYHSPPNHGVGRERKGSSDVLIDILKGHIREIRERAYNLLETTMNAMPIYFKAEVKWTVI